MNQCYFNAGGSVLKSSQHLTPDSRLLTPDTSYTVSAAITAPCFRPSIAAASSRSRPDR
jgi:hypothetical protein